MSARPFTCLDECTFCVSFVVVRDASQSAFAETTSAISEEELLLR